MVVPLTPPGQRKTRYDGSGKNMTPDCAGCPWFASGARRSRLETVFRPAIEVRGADGLCLWGKHLVALYGNGDGARHCQLDQKNPPGRERWESLYYFAEQINQALLVPKEESRTRAQEPTAPTGPDHFD